MRKLLPILLVLALCLSFLASCENMNSFLDGMINGTETEQTEKPSGDVTNIDEEKLAQAIEYLRVNFLDVSTVTGASYTLANIVTINFNDNVETLNVVWSIEVAEEHADDVKVGETTEDGKHVQIVINELVPEEVPYTLIATVTVGEFTKDIRFSRTVPAYHEFDFEDYIAAQKGDNVVVKGVISGIVYTNDSKIKAMYLNDEVGGFYIYTLTAESAALQLQVGQTVKVSGELDIYNGTYEIKNGIVELIDATIRELVPEDYTEIYVNAENLKDPALTRNQAHLVTIKGVEIIPQGSNDTYYQFKLAGKESYIRISSSVCPMSAEDQATFQAGYFEHIGWIANATGLITVYNEAFYLTPISVDAFEYISLPEKSDEEAVAYEKEILTAPASIVSDSEIDLPAVGTTYDKVAINWALDAEYDFASIVEGKLVVALPAEATVIRLIATLTAGEVTDTVEFEIAVASAVKDYKDVAFAIATAEALENGETTEEKYYFVGTIGEIYNETYFDFYLVDGDLSIVVYGLWQDELNNAHRYGTKSGYLGLPELTTGDTIYLYGNLQKYYNKNNETVTLEITNALLQPAPELGSHPKNPADVAFALEKAEALENGETTEEKYYFTGVVGEIYNETYFDFYLVDGEQSIVVYGLWQDEINNAHRYGTKSGYLGLPEFTVGDVVVIYGNIQKYYNKNNETVTPEITNALLISFEKVEVIDPETEYDIVIEAENATVTPSIEKGKNGTEFTFTVAVAEGYELVSVKVNGTALEAVEGVYTAAIDGETKIAVATREIALTAHAGTADDPLDAADAINIAKTLDGSAREISAEKYYITGVITDDPTANYVNFNLNDGTDNLLVYGLYLSTEPLVRFGTNRELKFTPVAKDQTVTLYGNIQNYNGKYEVVNGVLVSLTDEVKVAVEKYVLAAPVSAITEDGTTVDLGGATYLADVTIAWSLKDANENYVLLDENQLLVYLADEEASFTLVATITAGEASDTKEFAVSVAKKPTGDEPPQPETKTATFVSKDAGYEKAAVVETIVIDNVITLTFDKGTNTNATKYYSSGEAIRVYGGNTINVKAAEGITIVSINFLSSYSTDNTLLVGNDSYTNNTAIEVNGSEINFTVSGTKGNFRIASIEVRYTTAGGTEEPPVEPEEYTVTVNAENATVVVTPEKGEAGTPFEVSVTLAEGFDTVVVTIDGQEVTANNDGKYAGVIGENTVVNVVASKSVVIYSITVNAENATASVDPTSGAEGTSYTLTVTLAEGYDAVAVTVNGTAVELDAALTYSGTIAGETVINVVGSKSEPPAPAVGTLENPASVAFAIEKAEELENGATSDEKYYFTGVVGEIYNKTYFDFYLVDGEQSIVVYGLWQDEDNRYGTKSGYLGLPEFTVGDTVVIYGNLLKYYNANSETVTLEIANALLISFEKANIEEPVIESVQFAAYSENITEGYYIIAYNGYVAKAGVSSGRLTYDTVDETLTVIEDPDESIVWLIQKSGDYYTIYNESTKSYMASTGAKNKANLIEDGTDAKALWTITLTDTGFEIVNVYNAGAGVNANLRNNGTYGFACYSTSTGGALALFKLLPADTEPETPTINVEP